MFSISNIKQFKEKPVSNYSEKVTRLLASLLYIENKLFPENTDYLNFLSESFLIKEKSSSRSYNFLKLI